MYLSAGNARPSDVSDDVWPCESSVCLAVHLSAPNAFVHVPVLVGDVGGVGRGHAHAGRVRVSRGDAETVLGGSRRRERGG